MNVLALSLLGKKWREAKDAERFQIFSGGFLTIFGEIFLRCGFSNEFRS
jgi:hypothetical protein